MKTYIVDSFTDRPFKGNPAGVCFPEDEISDEIMQSVAAELGLSETAFVRAGKAANTYAIRYFSPKKEIPLCGHATLAAAKILFTSHGINELYFITIEELKLFITSNGKSIAMEFPVYDLVPTSVPPAMLSALGIAEVTHVAYSPNNKIILLEINSGDELAALQPDFVSLLRSYSGINGVLVTAAGNGSQYDYHYRYFWPWAGTDEDPVTGGVQTFLAKYWGEKLGKHTMKAFQSSARTGQMEVILEDNKVKVTGEAVIVFTGEMK